MESSSSSQLIAKANAHARLIQSGMAGVAVLLALVPHGLRQWIEPFVDSFGFANVCVVASFALISIYASWSAIWIVLGPGRWLARFIRTLVIYHLALSLTLSLLFTLYPGSPTARWIDLLAAFAGMSYGFGIQILIYAFAIWLLQLARYRVLYFDKAAQHLHPRRAGAGSSHTGTTILAGRIYLADAFALTALIAVYLGAWQPIGHAIEDNRLFGAPFLFVFAIAVCSFSALVGLVLALLPIVLSMLDHRGWRFQVVCHTTVLVAACGTLVILHHRGWLDEEATYTCITTAVAVASLLGLLIASMRKPADWFRFRLTRLHKEQR